MAAPTARSSSILIRVTKSERDLLNRTAREHGMTTGAWMRALAIAAARDPSPSGVWSQVVGIAKVLREDKSAG